MGKHVRSKSAQLHLEEHQQGCMWSILHGLKYHQWHYVKKKLPNLRQGGGSGRHSTGNGTTESSINAHHTDISPEHTNADGESLQKKRQFGPSTKISMKARIKALISEEKHRKKDGHRRSSTSPAHLQLIEASSPHHSDCHYRSSDDHFDMHGPQPLQKGTLGQEKLENSEQTLPQDDVFLVRCNATYGLDHPTYDGRDGSECRLGTCPDSPDRIDLGKELVLKVLHDKGSISAQHFDRPNAVRMKMGLQRFGTAPVSSQSGEEALALGTSRNREEEEESSKSKLGSLDQDTRLVRSDASVAVPVLFQKKQGKNQVVSRHFKSLKKKLKHVMKASRKEKHRIAMDGILDKIPRDHERSMEIKENVIQKWKDMASERDYGSPPRPDDPHGMKRMPSLDASLEKYCQLFESSFSIKAKHSGTRTSRVGGQDNDLPHEVHTRPLVRVWSLPELESSSFRTKQSSVFVLTETPVRTLTDTNKSRASSFDAESNQYFRLALEKLGAHVDNEVDDEKVDHSEASSVSKEEVRLASVASSQDMSDSTAGEHTSVDEDVIELPFVPSIEPEDTESNQRSLVLDGVESDSSAICCHETSRSDMPLPAESEVHPENAEISSYQLDMDLMYVPVDLKDIELFNFVKDVLELSGFGGRESLGRWHSGDQPVDPLVYEEVEGCSLPNLESLENNGGGHSDHLILFGLINEVLVNIYRRSFGYYPRPLFSLCRVHPMPEGFRVLEEVWASISFYTSLRPELDPAMDYVTVRELERHDGWMNLRSDSECVGLELEDLILDDLLGELICT